MRSNGIEIDNSIMVNSSMLTGMLMFTYDKIDVNAWQFFGMKDNCIRFSGLSMEADNSQSFLGRFCFNYAYQIAGRRWLHYFGGLHRAAKTTFHSRLTRKFFLHEVKEKAVCFCLRYLNELNYKVRASLSIGLYGRISPSIRFIELFKVKGLHPKTAEQNCFTS